MRKFTGIEAGRGLAATAVLFYHLARHLDRAFGTPSLSRVFQFGHAGVDFFFVVSGFIILFVHYPDIGRPERLLHYLVRRFTRVMPTYWVALAITVLMSVGGRHQTPSFTDLFWSLTLLPSNRELLLGVAWTLRYEVTFYAVFALLIWQRGAGVAAYVLWLAGLLAGFLTGSSPGFLPASLASAYNVEFLLGMAAAFAMRNAVIPHPRAFLLVGVLCFAAACVAEDIGLMDGYAAQARLIYGLPAGLIVLGVAEAGRQDLLRVPAMLQILGSASYSIYLFQFVFIGVGWKALQAGGVADRLPIAVLFVVLSAIALGGAILASRVVEFPLIRLLRRDDRGGRSAVTAAA